LVREEEFWEDSWTKPETVYPSRNIAVNEKFPERLQSAVGEMHRCFNAKAYTATAIAGRRAIEILCADRGIKERTLAESLAKMKDKSFIDGSLFEWAEGLRFAGNRAAHDIDTDVSAQDARDISEFTDALIEYVIVSRERFEQFKTRQSSRKSSKVIALASSVVVQAPGRLADWLAVSITLHRDSSYGIVAGLVPTSRFSAYISFTRTSDWIRTFACSC
jgi:hypothetical protein